ncbi:nuclease subunit B-like protein [Haloarcula japonica DSM 6131]|uniref:Nuclease subunit B-like protein n=1 Tax=Haloarcula japonica (strain ATCC 49778 / DSM 6131 / JCM 7785 / NBRC 101032 / NCIMB 13157 / TR-1) TaxID=1227453 RepID=M0L8M3_HALJT|nr:hypothetical protein [Haloarcula japonica]EMA28280.1 nuclease subunit B-like protein [Haloarcula japonica DSM 6131]
MTEYTLDRTTAETTGTLAGEPTSAALADSFSSRFSLTNSSVEQAERGRRVDISEASTAGLAEHYRPQMLAYA